MVSPRVGEMQGRIYKARRLLALSDFHAKAGNFGSVFGEIEVFSGQKKVFT